MTVQDQFYDHLSEHSQRTGFLTPDPLLIYLAKLLAERLERVDIIPEPSFAERYLELYTCHRLSEFKDYADSVLFFVSLLPEYGRRRGLDLEYYGNLGISVYYTLGDLAHDPRYTQLGNWFYHLQRFLNTALHSHSELELLDLDRYKY
jgi:hypothetical protein